MNYELYAEVIIDIAHEKVDRIFHYRIPTPLQLLLQVGMRVLVPFGRSNKKIEGYVLGITDKIEIASTKVKEILQIIDDSPILSEEMITLSKWMRDVYQCTLIECFHCVLPTGIQVRSQWIIEINSKTISSKIDLSSHSPLAQSVYEYIKKEGHGVPLKELEDRFGNQLVQVLYSLRRDKILIQRSVPQFKNLSKKIKMVSLISGSKMEQVYEDCRKKNYHAQVRILEFLLRNQQAPLLDMKQLLQVTDSSFRSLQQKGVLAIEEIEVKRNPDLGGPAIKDEFFTPTQEQKNVLQYIKKEMQTSMGQTILLHGVTGSGKTEVYLQVIQELLKEGKQAIVLVPEISLTPQITQRFIQRFGNQVAFTHSKLSIGERYDQWRKAKEGEVSIMVGPRSAIFTPFSSLGLVIIDEEHETTYKSDTTPKYHAREIAMKRCELSNGIVILGSATPSLESYFLAQKGVYHLTKMDHRATQHSLPQVYVVDMRKELVNGNRSMFSKDLYEALESNLERKEQTILFLNRRGHSTFVSCRSCGFVLKCSRCNISYTYHSPYASLRCHYCGEQTKSPRICPACSSSYIRFFGVGTQKVEEEVNALLPQARTLRMDLDTTSGKHGHTRILEQFYNQKADILIGTQMVAKGHDFPNVTLVGVLAADAMLYMEDFRSSERSFQLLTQVAGRAGRGDQKGRVYIQTYTPEHYSIQTAQKQDYEAFYKHELLYRKEMQYPPYTHLYSILLVGSKEKKVIRTSFFLADFLKSGYQGEIFQVIGPSPASISKINNEYRWRIMIKHPDQTLLQQYAYNRITHFLQKNNILDVQIYRDMNPLVMY